MTCKKQYFKILLTIFIAGHIHAAPNQIELENLLSNHYSIADGRCQLPKRMIGAQDPAVNKDKIFRDAARKLHLILKYESDHYILETKPIFINGPALLCIHEEITVLSTLARAAGLDGLDLMTNIGPYIEPFKSRHPRKYARELAIHEVDTNIKAFATDKTKEKYKIYYGVRLLLTENVSDDKDIYYRLGFVSKTIQLFSKLRVEARISLKPDDLKLFEDFWNNNGVNVIIRLILVEVRQLNPSELTFTTYELILNIFYSVYYLGKYCKFEETIQSFKFSLDATQFQHYIWIFVQFLIMNTDMDVETRFQMAYVHFVEYFKYPSSLTFFNGTEFKAAVNGFNNKYQNPKCKRNSINLVTWFIYEYVKHHQDQPETRSYVTQNEEELFTFDCTVEMFDTNRKYTKSLLGIISITAKTRLMTLDNYVTQQEKAIPECIKQFKDSSEQKTEYRNNLIESVNRHTLTIHIMRTRCGTADMYIHQYLLERINTLFKSYDKIRGFSLIQNGEQQPNPLQLTPDNKYEYISLPVEQQLILRKAIVNFSFWSGTQPIRLLVDTGCVVSQINVRTLRKDIQIHEDSSITIKGVTGHTAETIGTIDDYLLIEDARIPIKIHVYDDGIDLNTDGLFGWDLCLILHCVITANSLLVKIPSETHKIDAVINLFATTTTEGKIATRMEF